MPTSLLTRLRDEHAAADFLGVSVKTLRGWRCRGGGPAYRKLGAAVRYADEDLTEFVEAARRRNTSEAAR